MPKNKPSLILTQVDATGRQRRRTRGISAPGLDLRRSPDEMTPHTLRCTQPNSNVG